MNDSDDRAEHDAPDRAEAAEDDHREDEDREENWNWSALTVLRNDAEEHAGDAAERGAGARRPAASS